MSPSEPASDRHRCGRFRLGLPAWAFPGWSGRYFEDRPSRLASYAQVFDAVEGNTSFYRVPDARSVAAWAGAVAGSDFRFSFKLPKTVTHESTPNLTDLDAFLEAVTPLAPNLGPFLVQFPARVSPAKLDAFEPVFEKIARFGTFAIEPRHAAFFDDPAALEPVLERFAAARVTMDARAIHDGDLDHPEVRAARHEKPDVPALNLTYNGLSLTRLVLHPDLVSNGPYIERWAGHTAERLTAGIDCVMMIHCPNNLHCPPLAREFHERLRARPGMASLPALPPWPVTGQQSLW